jgi:hypothetical protein
MLNPDVPPPLEAICLKAMAKLPDNRYQTAAEFRADLERFRNGEPVLATPLLDSAATTQAIPGRAGADQTAMLGGTAADRATGYGYAEPEERRRMSVGWVVLSLLALVAVGLIAFLITRAVTGTGTPTGTTVQTPATTAATTTPQTTATTQPETTRSTSTSTTSTSTSTSTSTTTSTTTTTTTTVPPTT